MRTIGIKVVSRATGFAAVAAVIIVTAIHLRHKDTHPDNPAGIAVAPSTDPLARELIRCRAIGMAATDDAACASAWAENRCRFFTYAPSAPASPSVPAGKADHATPTPEAR
jgi:conjugative transfer region protein TrbK